MSDHLNLSERDLQLLAAGWDAAVKAMTYEDGSPVEVTKNANPFRQRGDHE